MLAVTPDEGVPVSTILIGVDSSARSEDAIALARRLALTGPAGLVVASIVGSEAARDDAHLAVRRMSGLLAGIDPERIRTGVVLGRSPAQGLHELAQAETAALVIVGSTHTGHLGRVRPGSTGERLLNGAPCAVAVAPHGYRTRRDDRLARVGVAYDGSLESRVALVVAQAAAHACGAKLLVVTVISTEVYGAGAWIGGPSYAATIAGVREELRRDLDNVVSALPADFAPEAVVLEGRPWRELADYSRTLDLLLIGSRGYGPLHAVIAGGTSGPVLHHAHCPVIVLPRGAEAPLDELFGGRAQAIA
jgi:nucleotide-binding universal stress UspA family protein